MMKVLKLQTWWKIIGLLLLAIMVGFSLFVKYDLLPVPEVSVSEVKGGYLNEQFYEYIVTSDAVIEQDGGAAMFIIRAKNNYWLDGTYAVKVQIDVLAANDSQVAVALLDHSSLSAQERHVVRNPPRNFNVEQRVRLVDVHH